MKHQPIPPQPAATVAPPAIAPQSVATLATHIPKPICPHATKALAARAQLARQVA